MLLCISFSEVLLLPYAVILPVKLWIRSHLYNCIDKLCEKSENIHKDHLFDICVVDLGTVESVVFKVHVVRPL